MKGIDKASCEKAVKLVIRLWKEALRRHEPVDIGIGYLVVTYKKPKRVIRLGRLVDIPKSPYIIKLYHYHNLPKSLKKAIIWKNKQLLSEKTSEE